MTFVRVQPGTFVMGSLEGEAGRDADETQREVTFTKGFHLAETPVTAGQWRAVMGGDPSASMTRWARLLSLGRQGGRGGRGGRGGGEDYPVTCVSWNEAVTFCAVLSEREGRSYGLPTEAEWEYACRAGSTTAYCFGDDRARLDEYAWFKGNARRSPHPVALKKPNAWGLFDMHGHVWEWCQDFARPYDPAGAPLTDPQGPVFGSSCVLRGGSWHDGPVCCRSAHRSRNTPVYRDRTVGFRIALDAMHPDSPATV
ncbi:MAG: formylglycine-generating enzyme family protein [Phycisphaerales bacterium]|nr:formylglycine-generating enzyme family protein [Phycisphaerales bacterium]